MELISSINLILKTFVIGLMLVIPDAYSKEAFFSSIAKQVAFGS